MVLERGIFILGNKNDEVYTHYLEDLINNGNFKPERDKAVFYSGRDNKKLAKDAVKKYGLQVVESTQAGKELHKEELYGRVGKNEARKCWEKSSSKYAGLAEGKVTTFVKGAEPDSIFRRVELGILVNNSKVTQINGVDRSIFQKAYAKEPNLACDLIVRAEKEAQVAAKKEQFQERLQDKEQRKEILAQREQARQPTSQQEETQTPSKTLSQAQMQMQQMIQQQFQRDAQRESHLKKGMEYEQ